METINIKFDEEQLKDIVEKVTENIIKEAKDNFYELSDTGSEGPKKKRSLMYLEANEFGADSELKRVYWGYVYNTLSSESASEFNLEYDFDRNEVDKLKSKGWKEEVVYR